MSVWIQGAAAWPSWRQLWRTFWRDSCLARWNVDMRRTLLVKSGSPPCTITTKGGQQRCSGWDTCSWVNSAVRRKRNFNLSFPIFESFHFKRRTKERKNKTKQTQQNFTLKRVAKWWEPSFVEECVCGLWVIYRNDAFSTAFSRTTKQPCYNSLQVSCMSSFAEVHPSVQKTKNTWYHWAPTLQIYIYIYHTVIITGTFV